MYYFLLVWTDRNGVKLNKAIYQIINKNFCYTSGRSNFTQNSKNLKVVVNQKGAIRSHYKKKH